MNRRMFILGDAKREARECVEAAGFEIVRRDPDIVLSHGGDGTLLRAERFLPGVPKLPARLGRGAQLCPLHQLPMVLERFASGSLERSELAMLELSIGKALRYAMNDVVLRNDNPALALRFRLVIDGRSTCEEYTGDGLVIASPFGSTGYFHSISRQRIESGLGIAFNNCTRARIEPLLVDGDASIRVELTRGPAVLVQDNDTRTIHLRQGHQFMVSRSERKAIVHGLDALACQDCMRFDEATFNPH
jgi:NAD kinase